MKMKRNSNGMPISKHGKGRPTTLTPERSKIICDAIRDGNYYDTACAAAGVNYATYRGWMVRGENEDGKIFIDFYKEVKRAEADAEQNLVAGWRAKCPDDWKATATFLERRYPERWARRERVQMEHSGKDGGPIDVEHRFSVIQKVISTADSRAQVAAAWRNKRRADDDDDDADFEEDDFEDSGY